MTINTVIYSVCNHIHFCFSKRLTLLHSGVNIHKFLCRKKFQFYRDKEMLHDSRQSILIIFKLNEIRSYNQNNFSVVHCIMKVMYILVQASLHVWPPSKRSSVLCGLYRLWNCQAGEVFTAFSQKVSEQPWGLFRSRLSEFLCVI